MKRRDMILAVVAVVVAIILLLMNGLLVLAIVVIPICYLIIKWKDKKNLGQDSTESSDIRTMEEAIEKLGTPSDVVTLNAVQANELSGVVLIYDQAKQMVINGHIFSFSDINDISYVNGATPYTVAEYQVIIHTGKDAVYLSVGYDNQYACDVTNQLRSHLIN